MRGGGVGSSHRQVYVNYDDNNDHDEETSTESSHDDRAALPTRNIMSSSKKRTMMTRIALVILILATMPMSSSSFSPPMPSHGRTTTTSSPNSSIRRHAASSSSSSSSSFLSPPGMVNDISATTTSVVVVVDVENVRGATSFRICHGALLSRVRLWREDRFIASSSSHADLEPMIWACDHGERPSAHHFPSTPHAASRVVSPPLPLDRRDDDDSVVVGVGGEWEGEDYRADVAITSNDVRMPRNFGVAFAGPGRTADDVIVDIVGLRCGGVLDDDDDDDDDAGRGEDAFDEGDNDEGDNDDRENGDDIGDEDDEDDDDDDNHDYRGETRPWSGRTNVAGTSSTRNTTVVITADAKLISRCQQARRMGRSASDLIFVEPASLLRQLERYRTSDVEEGSFLGGEEEGSAAAIGRRTTAMTGRSSTTTSGGDRRADGKTATMTSFRDSTIAMEQHAKFQARFQNVGSDAAGGANKGSMIVSEVINDDEDVDEGESDVVDDDSDEDDVVDNYDREEEDEDEDGFQSTNDSGAAALAAQLKTEQIRRHLLLSDAYYLARPSKNVRGRRAHTTVAAVHAKYKDRNISKTQQRKLYARRFGNGRREDMALAATRRKEDAARFQSILDRASGIDRIHGGGADHGSLGRNGPHAPSTTLLRMLLRKFDVETAVQSSGTLVENSYVDRTARSFSPNDGVDQLSSTLRVPLRGDTAQNDIDPPPLRIVIISDTHGFEGALSRFVDRPDGAGPSNESRNPVVHCDDFLLPKADVLLHCGDFAASGSKKTQRAAARRLDDFLARQTHIPEKIVVQGNHDPDTPAKVLFPNSKALYVRSSSTLSVNGVSFALQPYSRRMAFRSIRKGLSSSVPSLSECDILVSHEPPKGILDMTYHGFSAGSAYLRELVEHAEHKPRLWCCGHIHESRGVITKNFHPVHRHVDDKVDASTMVINASNANSGKANRIVSGAIVVEIERRPSDTLSEQSAENTLRSWRIDHADIFSDSADRSDGLAKLGNDLELYTTRPGVRRRKGVSQSTRQQMKNVSNIKVSK